MRESPGPGPVAAAHRLLIVTALACALVYAGWELREYGRSGEGAGLVRGLLALAVSAGIALYLRRLRDLGARLTPRHPGDR